MHAEMVLIIFSCLFIGQIVLVLWKQRHYKSFQLASLVGMCTNPIYFCLQLGFFRMLAVYTLFMIVSGFVVFLASRKPLSRQTPR